jgi:hypothetical protein
MKAKYYDGTKLLSMMDVNGNKPELYICTSNRTGGKTTYFSRMLVNRYIKEGKKFCLLYRYNYELDDCASNFFKDISSLFFPQYEMVSKSMSKGIYHELFLVDKRYEDETGCSCGYALSLNSADTLKKRSHLFSDVTAILFDEFQSETNHYCNDEVSKFQSIHTSLARGQGQQVKYLPVYMVSNPVSTINPYYVALGIADRLTPQVKFLRGNGYVLEQGYNESASKALQSSGFNKAFSTNSDYLSYASEGKYLNDSDTFIQKMNGNGNYLFTLRYEGKEYGVREYVRDGVIYVSDSVDSTFKVKIAVDLDSHDVNYVLLSRYDDYINRLRMLFNRGCFRFKNQQCKNAMLHMLCYKNL